MRRSYLDYAMSVIVGRALPDVRDGLKPVHRRVLYAMRELGNDWNKAYKKSARVVGDVIGKYHPHGDTAVYDTIVRMAQPFSMRAVLVDGQGNFGSVDGDPPAAMRYTEVRMARIAHELLADLDKETVDFVPNYDGQETEPSVLPNRFPNLLVNGSSGIAVGMATNIPPHNLAEVIDACLALVDDPSLGVLELMHYVRGPDFPTGAIVNGAAGIREAYLTGRGRVVMRARARIDTDKSSGHQSIIVYELPYQVNKARLLKSIAELVKERRLEGISELRDESDKDGMRMVIELRRSEVPEVVLNNLYKHTQMQSVFGINNVALVDGQPRLLNLKQILEAFVRHRREVVTRRTIFELRKARDRAHTLEGLGVALANLDEVIALIRRSSGPSEARSALTERLWALGDAVERMLERAGADASKPEGLPREQGRVQGGYRLSEAQAQAILDLRLHRLTALEQEKIIADYGVVLEEIAKLLRILTEPEELMQVIRNELQEVRERYQDPRRTEIVEMEENLTLEDLISEEDVVVTLSHAGYAKSQPLTDYRAQRRGGRGRIAATTKQEDFIDRLFIANTHDTILCFSNRGRVYWKKVYELPQAGRNARGKPIVNLLPLEDGERINAVLPVRDYPEDRYLLFATTSGVVKKTPLAAFSRPRTAGIIAVDLRPGDQLVNVAITDGRRRVMLFTDAGKAVCFDEGDIRPMGRTAAGVRGIRVGPKQQVIALVVVQEEGRILTVTQNGFGKRSDVDVYPVHGRGGQGVLSIAASERNGAVVGAVQVADDDEIMLITDGGTLVRTRVDEISVLGRNTQGVKLIDVSVGERLIGVDRIEAMAEAVDDEGDDEPTVE
jgi:DNA gyrase subunit A